MHKTFFQMEKTSILEVRLLASFEVQASSPDIWKCPASPKIHLFIQRIPLRPQPWSRKLELPGGQVGRSPPYSSWKQLASPCLTFRNMCFPMLNKISSLQVNHKWLRIFPRPRRSNPQSYGKKEHFKELAISKNPRWRRAVWSRTASAERMSSWSGLPSVSFILRTSTSLDRPMLGTLTLRYLMMNLVMAKPRGSSSLRSRILTSKYNFHFHS